MKKNSVINFDTDEKESIIDGIVEMYFNRNFGSTTKSDFEIFIFSEYMKHKEKNNQITKDFYISKELGITQNRVRVLKEKRELKYPSGNDWQGALVSALDCAKYDDGKIKIFIDDINVLNETRNYIETKGWFDDYSLNKKLLVLSKEAYVKVFSSFEEDKLKIDSKIIKKFIKDNKLETNFTSKLSNLSSEMLSSLMSELSKEVFMSLLQLIPFGNIGKKMIDCFDIFKGN